MAVTKNLIATSLTMEVESGVDNNGSPVYRKKSFSGVKADATPENCLDIGLAIKNVLGGNAKSISLAETHRLVRE
ncbi:MAG: DUF1659 domain-containing protein [Clostridium sp.]